MPIPGQDAVTRFLTNEQRFRDFINSVGYTSDSNIFVEGLPSFVNQFNSAIGLTENVRSEFRAADAVLSGRVGAVEIGQGSAVIGYDTQANLYADLAHADKSLAYVTSDSTASKNGLYRKSGASGSGSWIQSNFDRVGNLEILNSNLKNLKNIFAYGDGTTVTFNAGIVENRKGSSLIRFDWQGAKTLSKVARTNAVFPSAAFDDVQWAKLNSGTGSIPVVTPNAYVAPDGTTTADGVVFNRGAGNTTADYSLLNGRATAVIPNGNYPSSIWARTTDGSTVQMMIGTQGTDTPLFTITPTWQEFKINSPQVNTTDYMRIWTRGSFNTTQIANLAIWGAMMGCEGSYIPTTTAAATVTDYSVSGENVTLSSAPISGAALYWDSILDIILPPKMYAVLGHEMNVYFDNLIGRNASDFLWDITCSWGSHQEERWNYTGNGSAGSGIFYVSAYCKENQNLVAKNTSYITVKASTVGNGITKKCLFIGDSTTAGGITTGEIVNLFTSDVMHITLIGTKGTGTNKHEGISGWTVNQFYTDPTSPFVFSGAFNFLTYMTNNSFSGLDYVFINLGINDVFNAVTDNDVATIASSMITQLEAMILNIHTYSSTIKIGIAITTPPPSSQDAFGANYNNGQTKWRYKHNLTILQRALINQFNSRETVDKVFIVPINLNLDTVHNMLLASSAPWNSRATINTQRQTNGVHPDDPGYKQCADSYYAFLKCQEI